MDRPFDNSSSRVAQVLIGDGGPSSKTQLSTNRSTPSLRALFQVDTVVRVFETHDEAEDAIRQLYAAGVDMRTLSIAAKDTHVVEHVSGFYTAGDRMLHWGKLGAFWGAVWGFVFDAAIFAIPGIGPVILGGPLVSWIVAVLEGALVFGSVSAVGAGLVSIGFPEHSVIEYETALKTDKFLLIVHGTSADVSKAREIAGGVRHSYLDTSKLQPLVH